MKVAVISRMKWLLIFIGPLMGILIFFNIYPLIYSVWLALHGWMLSTRLNPPFVGLGNFIMVFQDARFVNSIINTLIFMGSAVGIEFFLGLAIALILIRPALRGAAVFRTLIIVPMIVAPITVGYTFRLLFHPNAGPVNYLLGFLGISWINWVADPKVALFSVVIADVWEWTPFVSLILLAGMHSLPLEIYEAARIDGASSFKLFSHITLPLLLPVIMICLMLRIIDTFRMFDVVYVLTGGGPATASELISLYVYRVGFSFFKLGYAAAMSWILLVIIIFVVYGFFTKFIKIK